MNNHDHGNTLLRHCGEPEMPAPPSRQTAWGSFCAGELVREIESLRQQNAALEEANQALAKRGVYLENENRELRDRLIGREFD